MNYLSILSPADILLLTNQNTTHSEFLKLTFLDLLLKKVIKTFEVERQPHPSQDIRVYKYIGIGEKYKTYIWKNHEAFFLSSFLSDNNTQILFRNMVKIGYENSRNKYHFKNELLKTPFLTKCYKKNFLQLIFGGQSISQYGYEVKEKIEKEIDVLNNDFKDIETIDNQKAIKYIKQIGGNVFLLKNINYDLLTQIDVDLATEMNKNNFSENSNGCSGCGFGDFSVSFDSGCSSSGCGGDSGCSSGCGGCGGCGGD